MGSVIRLDFVIPSLSLWVLTRLLTQAIYRWVRVFSIKMSPSSGRLKKGTLMSHSYVGNLMHCTFSTKDRSPFIDSTKEHHRRKIFHEEFLELLNKHGIEYDSRYVV